jgi:diguanylate cyclase (GGDEF)-like protein/PAS domain S-box-containing protein
MMATLAVPIFVLDRTGRVIMWNQACERLTGVPAEEVLGTRDHWRCFYENQCQTLADIMLANSGGELSSLYARHVAHAPSARLNAESWCEMPRAGRRRYLAADASPVFDDDGRLTAVVETLRDLTDEKEAQVALEQLATRDGLTGLANRRCFDDTLHAEWTRAMRSEQPLSLLMVDVDHFKSYNDAHGHLGGDACLKRIAGAVSSEMRANDLVARYGGEEFAVILPNQSLKGAAIVAERIRARVERLHMPGATVALAGAGRPALSLADESYPARFVTVSIGAATALASHQHTASALVAIADAALYRAKHLGRNRISIPG